MLERWIVTGPEISRVLEEFTTVNDSDDSEWRPHHEEGSASQQRFQRHTKDLMELLLSNGNPFEESSKDLVTLDNKVCESAAAAASVLKVESMGQEQYNNFKKNVLDSHDTPLTAPIKQNNLMLFHEKKTRKKTAAKLRMQHFKRHAELYGKAFIVLESRSGNLEDFFCHESSPYPPALSCEGSLNSWKTFESYFDKVFCPRVQRDLKRSTRVDIVWDQLYSSESNEENDVDLLRMRLFSQKTRDVERIPPNNGFFGSTSQKECLPSKHLDNSPHVYNA
ncbi:unnamed protein product [Arctogadus glacialis]